MMFCFAKIKGDTFALDYKELLTAREVKKGLSF